MKIQDAIVLITGGGVRLGRGHGNALRGEGRLGRHP